MLQIQVGSCAAATMRPFCLLVDLLHVLVRLVASHIQSVGRRRSASYRLLTDLVVCASFSPFDYLHYRLVIIAG